MVCGFDNTCLSQPTRATPTALLHVTYCCKYCRTLGFIVYAFDNTCLSQPTRATPTALLHVTYCCKYCRTLGFIVYAFDNTCLSQPTRATPTALLHVTYCCKYCRTLGFIKPRLSLFTFHLSAVYRLSWANVPLSFHQGGAQVCCAEHSLRHRDSLLPRLQPSSSQR